MTAHVEAMGHRVAYAKFHASDGPFNFDTLTPGPLIYWIADDPGRAVGPAGFDRPSLGRIFSSVDVAIVTSSRTNRMPYAVAADGALNGLDVAMIETRLDREYEWAAFINEHAPRSVPLHIFRPGRRP